MNRPREGSAANACTLVSTPDADQKVPSSDSEKVAIASSRSEPPKLPRFS